MKKDKLIIKDHKGNKMMANVIKRYKIVPSEFDRVTIEIIPESHKMVNKKQFVKLKLSKYDKLMESVKKAKNYNKHATLFVKTRGLFNFNDPTETVYTDEKAIEKIVDSLMHEKRLRQSAESKLARLGKARTIFGFTILRGSL